MAWTTVSTQISGTTVTAVLWNELVNNMLHMEEVGHQPITSDVSVTATTEGTANSVVSLGAITYEAVEHRFSFFSPSCRPDTGAAGRTLTFVLLDSTTVVYGIWGRMAAPAAAAANAPVSLEARFTPTAGSHTYNVRAFVSAGTGLIQANTGGAGTIAPAFLCVERVIT